MRSFRALDEYLVHWRLLQSHRMSTTIQLEEHRPREAMPEALDRDLQLAIHGVEELHALMLQFEKDGLQQLTRVHATHRASARNLLHYLALRSRDVRPLQETLRDLGLSSLGRSEAHAMCTLEAVLSVLQRLAGRVFERAPLTDRIPSFEDGRALLEEHAAALLGEPPKTRRVRILVTLPTQAAHDPALVRGLIERGVDCVRINCAHDDQSIWRKTILNVRRAERAAGRRVPILMDLGGPKLRTGPIEAPPVALRVKPSRDDLGRVLRAAQLLLCPRGSRMQTPSECAARLELDRRWLAQLGDDARVEFEDARGAKRRLSVLQRRRSAVIAALAHTAYFVPGTKLRDVRSGRVCEIGSLPRAEGCLRLRPGDRVELTARLDPGHDASRDADGRQLTPARIGCTLPEVLGQARVGQRVWFDDGRIGARILKASPAELLLEIDHADADGEKLRADKGINLPETELGMSALTGKDLVDLEFVAEHADAVALSFVREPADVELLHERLRALNRRELGVVLKIETRQAFERLPELILAAMHSPRIGVMIARGDLAVECGFERLAEIQEEILWICEAAHVPVIWATQVLESLARTGRPSRAEITDAAMAERAECVMLNKGPHIDAAVSALDDIMRRMEGHQQKKSAMLRPLRLAHRLTH
ncbi:MAG: pyruvate kinase [Planctomycetes bacterium]|nr:pyruvate kinase [Planctomycetota bacterium]